MMRDALDRYYTPDALAVACLQVLVERLGQPPAVLLEPCAGGGAFGRAALALGIVDVRGCDVDPDAAPGYPCDQISAADWRPCVAGDVWIVTNPHYTGIYDTVQTMRALQEHTRARVLALLLRATTIEQLLHRGDPPAALWVSDLRPRWGGPGGAALTSGDTCGSVLAVWGRAPLRTATTIQALPAWRAKGRAS
jgi:hypothetical protein